MASSPEVQGHFAQATHAERLMDFMIEDLLPRGPAYADWVLVVMFYAAVHRCMAVLIRDHGQKPISHQDKRGVTGEIYLGRINAVRVFIGEDEGLALKDLYDRSLDARYKTRYPVATNLKDALTTVNLHRVNLKIIQDACRP